MLDDDEIAAHLGGDAFSVEEGEPEWRGMGLDADRRRGHLGAVGPRLLRGGIRRHAGRPAIVRTLFDDRDQIGRNLVALVVTLVHRRPADRSRVEGSPTGLRSPVAMISRSLPSGLAGKPSRGSALLRRKCCRTSRLPGKASRPARRRPCACGVHRWEIGDDDLLLANRSSRVVGNRLT